MDLKLIIWLVVIVILGLFTLGVIKNSLRSKWGDLTFKTAMLCWVSIIFVFLTKMSPINFLYMIPMSYPVAFYFSSLAQAQDAINRGLKNPKSFDLIESRVRINKSEYLAPSLMVYIIFLWIAFFVSKYFFIN